VSGPGEVVLAGLGTVMVLLAVAIPGLAWSRWAVPWVHTLPERVALAMGVGLIVTAPTLTLLVWLGLLRPALTVAALLALSVAPTVLRLLPSGAPARSEWGWFQLRWPQLRWPQLRRDWSLIALAGALLLFVLIVLPSVLIVARTGIPFSSTVWYYADLARRVAEAGGLPAGTVEWGTQLPFQTDYAFFTSHAAALFQLLPGSLTVKVEAYRLAVLLVGLTMAVALFRRWLPLWSAILGAALVFGADRVALKFLSFKPETFGVVLVLFAIWALDRGMARASPRSLALALVAGLAAFLGHAEAFLLLGPAAVGLALGRVLPGALRAPRSPQLWLPRAVRLTVMAGLVFGGAFLAGLAGNAVLSGELRLLSYADRSAPAPPAEEFVQEVPDGWTLTSDPTWDFYVAAASPSALGTPPPGTLDPARRFVRLLPGGISGLFDAWPGLAVRDPVRLTLLAVLLAGPFAGWRLLDVRRRRLLLTWLVSSGALFLGSALFVLLYDRYVPMRVGPQRLFPYVQLAIAAVVAVDLWLIQRLVARRLGSLGTAGRAPRRRAGLLGLAVSALVLTLILAGPAGRPVGTAEGNRLTSVGHEAYSWLAANTPPGARILTNAYTDGVIAALARRDGVLEGRAPYLERSGLLAEAIVRILAARAAFERPASDQVRAFLERYGVDYVLVARADVASAELGGYRPFPVALDELRSLDRLRLIRQFGGGRLELYEVQ
jgi:hypothetical protein